MLTLTSWLWLTVRLLGTVTVLVTPPGPLSPSLLGPGSPADASKRTIALPASAPAPEPSLPGTPAPAPVVGEIEAALARALQRFSAKDTTGVLAYVSDQYRTGPLTKEVIRGQLVAMFSVYDAVQARVRIDDIRMVGDHAWVYSTGGVSGLLPWVGTWVPLLEWNRQLEVARREQGVWRLFGYQQ